MGSVGTVLSWAVSITMDVPFCVEALEYALGQGQPEIFNTDQGAQLTSQVFTARRKEGGIRISLDGRGRALDHVFVERLGRQSSLRRCICETIKRFGRQGKA